MPNITLPPVPSRGTAPTKKVAETAATPGFHLSFGAPDTTAGRRTILYGEGGVGKTTLCASLPGKSAFIDLDKSLLKLPALRPALEGGNLVAVQGVARWEDLRAAIAAPGWDGIDNLVLDTVTVAEAMATDYVLRTVRKERGESAKSVEDYGYGKGYRYVADAFELLIAELERHTDAGRNVILVCHSLIQQNTDPTDADFPRYEPKLLHTSSGKVSLRLRLRDWADDVIYVARDRAVVDGKAVAGTSRTAYPTDMGWCMAKSRQLTEPMPLTDPATFWAALFGAP